MLRTKVWAVLLSEWVSQAISSINREQQNMVWERKGGNKESMGPLRPSRTQSGLLSYIEYDRKLLEGRLYVCTGSRTDCTIIWRMGSTVRKLRWSQKRKWHPEWGQKVVKMTSSSQTWEWAPQKTGTGQVTLAQEVSFQSFRKAAR